MNKITTSYVLILIVLGSIILHLHASTNGDDNNPDWCLETRANNEYSECRLNESEHRLVCFNGVNENWRSKFEIVHTFVICNWPNETFDPGEVLRGFASLRTLVITNGNLTRLSTPFPEEIQSLEKISLIGTKLQKLRRDVFANLPTLRHLDLRNNFIAELDLDAFDASTLQDVRLTGNPLKCTENAAWILDSREGSLASVVVDKEKLRCSVPYDGRPLVPVVQIIMTLKEECKFTVCDCELVYVVGRGGKQIQKDLLAFVSVNCSYRDLTKMPAFLPANTTTLRLTGNKISDLTPLVGNSVYKQVLDLYLDENLVESIVQLEGSDWLEHFRLLSLRGNDLSDLPTYALENVLLHSGNAHSLYLGNNPWRCDCLFTPGFQDMLIRYAHLIKDINDVRCSIDSSDENVNKQIRDLTRTEICISQEEDPWLHPLDILNIILASLIFLILGKLLYDYWFFKKTGKLPWIVAKIP